MDLSRQEYPALLPSLQPDQAINVLDDRVALINKINVDIADFLQERRRIEERYAADLRKLARRPHAENSAALGVFDMPWSRIVASTENLAQSHETFASKIETDVETPLRQYGTKNREMQSITTIQGNLASIAKDLTKARDKADKIGLRGGRKADDASSNVDNASREWESQSPYVFEQLQALDENRVNNLRDVLTQLQTHELDQLEKNRASAEACLNALLNVETADEIKTFAAKIAQGQSSSVRRQSSTATDRPRSSVGIVPPAPPPPRNSDSRHSTWSTQDRLATVSEATPDKKSKIGGLKRLGTVMRGKKGAAPPPPQGAAEKKKEKSRGFAPFRRGDSSRSFHDLEESGRDLTPITSHTDRASLADRPTTSDHRAPPNQETNTTGPAELNGVSESQKTTGGEFPAPLVPTQAQATQPSHIVGNTQSPQPVQPVQSYQQSAAQAQAPMLSAQTHSSNNDAPVLPPVGGLYTIPSIEDTARNLTIRDEPIPEDAGEAQKAMSNMANQLRLQAQNSGVNRIQGSVRGRRDVRNTIFVQSGTEIPGLSSQNNAAAQATAPTAVPPAAASAVDRNAASPILSPSAGRSSISALLEEQTRGSDANSIRSAQTLSAVAQHPELSSPGLNASIIETVTSYFSETGITQSVVVGEIAFSHIVGSTLAPHETETVRLQNFQILEKVAANPTFVTPFNPSGASAEEQAGSYNITLTNIRRAAPTVGLKYQFHINANNLSQYSPILLTPAWQILEGQASAIILYELNPGFALPFNASGTRDLVLKNVVLSVGLDDKEINSGKATSAMMSPTQGAVFRKKANCVIWRFPELRVGEAKERLLVRFMTEGLAKKGTIELSFEAPDITAGELAVERLGAAGHLETDPFADEVVARKSGEGAAGHWETLPTKRMLITGRYSAS